MPYLRSVCTVVDDRRRKAKNRKHPYECFRFSKPFVQQLEIRTQVRLSTLNEANEGVRGLFALIDANTGRDMGLDHVEDASLAKITAKAKQGLLLKEDFRWMAR